MMTTRGGAISRVLGPTLSLNLMSTALHKVVPLMDPQNNKPAVSLKFYLNWRIGEHLRCNLILNEDLSLKPKSFLLFIVFIISGPGPW